MIRILAPHFVAGVDLDTKRAAPIIGYMGSWSAERIASYCKSKCWQWERIA